MDPKVNYTSVGIYVVLLSVLFAGLVVWLSSEKVKHYNHYLIFLKESVAGLGEHAAVKYNGVDVGYVDKVALDHDNPQEVRLLVKIDSSVPITQSTTATLMSQGITGYNFIGLKSKTPNASPLQKAKGEAYPVIPSEPSLLLQLNEALRDVTTGLKGMGDSFKGINDSVRKVFSTENMTSLQNILNKTSTASNQFPETMENIKGAAAGLTKASDQVKITLEGSKNTLKNFDGTLKSLNDQTLPEIYQAAHVLKQTLDDIKVITSQLKQNPSSLVRGTQPPPLGPGE